MVFSNPAFRLAYKIGVQDLFDVVAPHLPDALYRSVEAWRRDLERWDGGPPPALPEELRRDAPFLLNGQRDG